jgi:hypothetical protein
LNYDQPSEVNGGSPIYCLPSWSAKTIEAIGAYAGDASCRCETRSQKQHTNVALMTRVLETSNPITYLYDEGKPKWE